MSFFVATSCANNNIPKIYNDENVIVDFEELFDNKDSLKDFLSGMYWHDSIVGSEYIKVDYIERMLENIESRISDKGFLNLNKIKMNPTCCSIYIFNNVNQINNYQIIIPISLYYNAFVDSDYWSFEDFKDRVFK